MAIGLEALPFLGAATIILCLAWVWRGAGASLPLAAYGASLVATALFLLALTVPPAQWTEIVCDRLSLAHVGLTAIVLAAGLGALAVERLGQEAGWVARLILAGSIGLARLALMATAIPQCAGDPYANLSAEARYWLDAVSEAQPLIDFYQRKPGAAVAYASLPLAAAVLAPAPA